MRILWFIARVMLTTLSIISRDRQLVNAKIVKDFVVWGKPPPSQPKACETVPPHLTLHFQQSRNRIYFLHQLPTPKVHVIGASLLWSELWSLLDVRFGRHPGLNLLYIMSTRGWKSRRSALQMISIEAKYWTRQHGEHSPPSISYVVLTLSMQRRVRQINRRSPQTTIHKRSH
jgi:hypothetical protein